VLLDRKDPKEYKDPRGIQVRKEQREQQDRALLLVEQPVSYLLKNQRPITTLNGVLKLLPEQLPQQADLTEIFIYNIHDHNSTTSRSCGKQRLPVL
jgi:hypothetical protein